MAFPPDTSSADLGDRPNLDLTLIGLFTILVASLLGSLPPLSFNMRSPSTWRAVRILKAVSAGGVLALALIHVMGDSFAEFGGLPEGSASELAIGYPWAALCALFAIMFMAVLENILSVHHLRSGTQQHELPASHADPPASHDHTIVKCSSTPLPMPQLARHSHTHQASSRSVPDSEPHGCSSSAIDPHGHFCPGGIQNTVLWVHSRDVDPLSCSKEKVNESGLDSSSNSSSTAVSSQRRALVVAYLMEIGCIFHSVIIGIDLGLGGSSRAATVTRVIVLCVHQLIEGIGLGTVVHDAGFPRAKEIAMCVVYSLTTPIGVAVGIAVQSTYDPDSVIALGMNGAFNGVSAGLLLYVGLVTLLMEEFSNSELLHRSNDRTRWGMYAALFAAAGCMSVIGIWA
ncbi:MAG: hypothetical protein WDW36_004762 [Sanguina aurantia]